MRIHRILPVSRVNGPGSRFVVWVQGCSRCCPGCFNPLTHAGDRGYEMPIAGILKEIPRTFVEGITVSGGEPFEQPEELALLLRAAKETGLHVLVYTGFSYETLAAGQGRVLQSLRFIDFLIDGAFEQGNPPVLPWTGSGNQRILPLRDGKITGEYQVSEGSADRADGEFYIGGDGTVIATGIIDSEALRLA